MKVYIEKQKIKDPERFTFPAMSVDLTPKAIKDLKLTKALERFGKNLAKVMRKEYSKEVIGVEMTGINFIMILK